MEYFYGDGGDVKPMVHYVPASLENITEVVAYVMGTNNEGQMKTMVKSANSWCKRALNEDGMAKDSILQLGTYKKALDSYDMTWSNQWRHVRQRFTGAIDDLVDCNAWSFVDWLTFPMFAGGLV